jgi:hypothetical protein
LWDFFFSLFSPFVFPSHPTHWAKKKGEVRIFGVRCKNMRGHHIYMVWKAKGGGGSGRKRREREEKEKEDSNGEITQEKKKRTHSKSTQGKRA